MKKLLITGAAAGMLLVSAAGAFATGPNLLISNNLEELSNNVNVWANSGKNNLYASGDETSVKNSFISTGAVGVSASVLNQINSNSFDCGCILGLVGEGQHHLNAMFTNNAEDVSNDLHIWANSGKNNLYASDGWKDPKVEGSNIQTGEVAVGVAVSNFVNTNIFGDKSVH